jgi:hypothetical protein
VRRLVLAAVASACAAAPATAGAAGVQVSGADATLDAPVGCETLEPFG